MVNILNSISAKARSKILIFLFLLITIFVTTRNTDGGLVNLFSFTGPKQLNETQVWKLFSIDSQHLNPFHYDTQLPSMDGGTILSYWDSPLPYGTSFLLSKLLFFLGGARFIAAVKIYTLLNFLATYLVIFLILRHFKVNLFVALIIPALALNQRYILYHLFSISMGGYWALLLPLYLLLILDRRKLRSYLFLGLGIALSFLQNPYYFYFSFIFLLIPFISSFYKDCRQSAKEGLLKWGLVGVSALAPIFIIKGVDLYAILTHSVTDSFARTQDQKQILTYRPWWHLIPNIYSPIYFLRDNFFSVNKFLSKYIDNLTLWYPDSLNALYLGVVNIFVFVICLVIYLKKGGLKVLKSKTVYWLGFILGLILTFRQEVFVNFGRWHHLVLPGYYVQKTVPIVTNQYYGYLAILLFFMVFGFLIHKLFFAGGGKVKVVGFMLLAVVGMSIFNFHIPTVTSCTISKKNDLYEYLQKISAKRLYIYLASEKCEPEINPFALPVGLTQTLHSDGRYNQIYHQTPIFAPDSFASVDNYQYKEPLLSLRTMKTVVTDDNNKDLQKLGVQEIVLITESIDAQWYWKYQLKPLYKSSKIPTIFKDSIVFSITQ